MMETEARRWWRPRKIAAAVIGWPSALVLGVSFSAMFLAPDIAVWPLGLSLLGIATAVIISSKTLRQKIAGKVRGDNTAVGGENGRE